MRGPRWLDVDRERTNAHRRRPRPYGVVDGGVRAPGSEQAQRPIRRLGGCPRPSVPCSPWSSPEAQRPLLPSARFGRGAGVKEFRQLVARLLRTWWGRLLGPIALASMGLPVSGRATLGLLLVGVSLTGATEIAVRRRESFENKVLEELFGDSVTSRIMDLTRFIEKDYATPGGRVRANVMVVQRENDEEHLVMTYTSYGYTPAELKVRWRKGEGAAGQAWASGRSVTAPNGGQPLPRARNGNNSWSMTPEQIDACRGVKMVVSAAIFDPRDRRRVYGVLSVDDTVPPGDHLDDITQAVAYLANEIERQLNRAVAATDDREMRGESGA